MILVAQDHETNQQVLIRQLTALGYAADRVSNGQHALQHWRAGGYSLLLTDLQMHGLDGYQLATTIRTEEPVHQRTPIIALGTNALAENPERYRAAGLDDFICKPTTLPGLQAMLGKWLSPLSQPTEPTLANHTGPYTSALDLSVLKDLIGNQTEFIDEILRAFSSTALEVTATLHAAVSAGATSDAAEAAHKLKSSARAVGALQLADWCSTIEQAGQSTRTHELPALLSGFDAEMLIVNQALNQHLDHMPSLTSPPSTTHLKSES